MRRFFAFALALSIGISGLTATGALAGSPVYETGPTTIVDPIPMQPDAPAGSSGMPGSGAGSQPMDGTYTVALVGLAVIVIGLIVTSD